MKPNELNKASEIKSWHIRDQCPRKTKRCHLKPQGLFGWAGKLQLMVKDGIIMGEDIFNGLILPS